MDIAFDAFISYSRTDERVARALQRALESRTVRLAGGERKRLRVFLDRSDMATGPYYEFIGRALASAGKLIVLCSPAAARSPFVDDEVSRYLQSHSPADIVPVLVKGDPTIGAGAEGPFSERLLEALGVPAFADLRGFRGHWRTLRRPKYSEPWYSILSQILEVPRRTLEKVEERRARAQWILITSAAGCAIAVLTVALIFAIASRREAVLQREIAQERAKILVSGEIARHVVGAEDMPASRALLLGAQAASLARTPGATGALLTALERNRNFYRIIRLPARMRPPATGLDEIPERLRSVAISAGGGIVCAITEKHWMAWRTETRQVIAQGDLDQRYSRVSFVTPDRLMLHGDTGHSVFALALKEGAVPQRLFEGQVTSATASEASGVVAAITQAGSLALFDVRSSAATMPLARHFTPGADVSVSPDGRRLTIIDGGTLESWTVSGTLLSPLGKPVRHPLVDPAAIRSTHNRAPRLDPVLATRLGVERTETFLNALEELNLPANLRQGTLAASLSPDGAYVIIGLRDGTVSILNTTDFESIASWTRPEYNGTVNEIFRAAMDVAWAPGGDMAVVGFLDGEIWVLQLQSSSDLVAYQTFDGQHVFLSGPDGDAAFRVLVDGAAYAIAKTGGRLDKKAVAPNPSRRLPSTGVAGRVFRIIESGEPASRMVVLERLRLEGDHYLANNYDDPDGSRLFIVNDLDNPVLRQVDIGWAGMVVASQLSADGSTLAIARENGSLNLIDVRRAAITSSPIRSTYSDVFYQVKDLALSEDGHTVWWVNGSGTLRKWSGAPGAAGKENSREFGEELTTLVASRDGKYLVVGDKLGGLRMIDAGTLDSASSRFEVFSGTPVESLSISHDQVAVRSGKQVAIVELDPARLVDIVCRGVGRALTPSEVEPYTLGMAIEPPCRREPD